MLMKFEVGDILIDAGNDKENPLKSAKVLCIIEYEGLSFYELEFGKDDCSRLLVEEVEIEWVKAPVGSVGWLIQQLSEYAPTEMVHTMNYNYGFLEVGALKEVFERDEGGVMIWGS